MDSLERIKTHIMKMVFDAKNQRIRPHDLEKSISREIGVLISETKEALKELIQMGRLVFTYRDPCSYVEFPVVERHHAARPMKVIRDTKGDLWLCDSDVIPSRDPAKDGCWRCGEMAFTRND